MSVVKVIEILAESDKSWEHAVQTAVSEAAKTIHGIKSVWIKELQAVVENNQVTRYRADCKLSFVLDQDRKGS